MNTRHMLPSHSEKPTMISAPTSERLAGTDMVATSGGHANTRDPEIRKSSAEMWRRGAIRWMELALQVRWEVTAVGDISLHTLLPPTLSFVLSPPKL